MRRKRLSTRGPQLVGNVLDEPELGEHLLLRHALGADGHAGEAALGADADALHGLGLGDALALGDDGGGLLDAVADELGGLELGLLGGDNAEDDVLALGEMAEGLEAAGAGVVVLEEEGVVV